MKQEEFARQHSDRAVKQPQGVGNVAPALPDVSDVPPESVRDEIAATEARLTALRARQTATAAQEYPKVLYHGDHAHEDVSKRVAPVTVAGRLDEEKARELGWVHGNPGEASASGETPNATEHTREDENQRRDLPAQMAVDQDARTGKPPVDQVVDSDATDAPDKAKKGAK